MTVSSGSVDRPLFGPDGKWVVFNSNRGVRRACTRGPREPGLRMDEARGVECWRRALYRPPPDGGLLYLLLEQDGFRAEERFCLIYERRLIDTNGFVFVPSAELTETDVVESLIEVGYSVRDALRLIAGARLSLHGTHPRCSGRSTNDGSS